MCAGTIKPGDEVEILGLRQPLKTVVTGVEMFKKSMQQGQVGTGAVGISGLKVTTKCVKSNNEMIRCFPITLTLHRGISLAAGL
jgi:elongation factor Tu